jgi:hypothetical protein
VASSTASAKGHYGCVISLARLRRNKVNARSPPGERTAEGSAGAGSNGKTSCVRMNDPRAGGGLPLLVAFFLHAVDQIGRSRSGSACDLAGQSLGGEHPLIRHRRGMQWSRRHLLTQGRHPLLRLQPGRPWGGHGPCRWGITASQPSAGQTRGSAPSACSYL